MADELKMFFEFKLDQKLRHAIHRDWGIFYKQRIQWDNAQENFKESYKLDEEDIIPLLENSRCKLQRSFIDDALIDAENCLNLNPVHLPVLHQRINCIYEQNNFERSLKETYNTFYINEKMIKNKHECKDKLTTIKENLNQAIGTEGGPCLHKMRGEIRKIQKEDAQKTLDTRPLWKVLRDKGECDVVSERLAKKKKQPPILKRKKDQNYNVLNNMYLGVTASDVTFLKNLLTDERLDLVQIPKSSAGMLDRIERDFVRVEKWRQMLKARQPVYSKRFTMIKNEAKAEAYTEGNLYRIQYQTRRDIFKQLQDIRKLMKKGKLKYLLDYVQTIISNYYSIKTRRVFPRKFEFISELCNIVGLAYLENLHVPTNIMIVPQKERLYLLLGIPKEKARDESKKERKFGDRKDFTDPDEPDYAFIDYKKKVEHLEYMIGLSSYPVEICYLFHEAAKLHLTQNKVDETKVLGRKIIENGKNCGNWVWQYLGYLMIIRGDTVQNNLNRVQENLNKSIEIVEHLNENVRHFNETAVQINQTDLNDKLLEEEMKRKLIEADYEMRKRNREKLFSRQSN